MNWSELESFLTDGIASQGRQISLYTGQAGADYLAHAMAIENSVGFVEWMESRGKVDSETAKSLITMLRSEDIYNFNIAILAIEQLKK